MINYIQFAEKYLTQPVRRRYVDNVKKDVWISLETDLSKAIPADALCGSFGFSSSVEGIEAEMYWYDIAEELRSEHGSNGAIYTIRA
jgi:hypothetical protein